MNTTLSPHLKDLENESIHILRETAGQFDKIALLFSGGKDSVVVFELARRAFAPAQIPFELLHVDTGHNFPEVITFRDNLIERTGARLRVAKVQDWIDRGDLQERPDGTRNPLQTIPLVETIEAQGYDAVLGGARRDEERARAKERIFSVRDSFGGWDPRRQHRRIPRHPSSLPRLRHRALERTSRTLQRRTRPTHRRRHRSTLRRMARQPHQRHRTRRIRRHHPRTTQPLHHPQTPTRTRTLDTTHLPHGSYPRNHPQRVGSTP